MNTNNEIQNEMDIKEESAVSLELDIRSTQDQIHDEEDETHIIFLTDHLDILKYELGKVNADIYLLRNELKIFENGKKFLMN